MYENSLFLLIPTSFVACGAAWVLMGFKFMLSSVLTWGDGEVSCCLVIHPLIAHAMDDHIGGFLFFNSTSLCAITKL